MTIYLRHQSPNGSSDATETSGPPYTFPRSCTEWGLHNGKVANPLVRSYRTFPPLPLHKCKGGISLLHLP